MQGAKAAAAAWRKSLLEGLSDVLAVNAEEPCSPAADEAGMFGTVRLQLCVQHLPEATSWLAERVSSQCKLTESKQPCYAVSFPTVTQGCLDCGRKMRVVRICWEPHWKDSGRASGEGLNE